MQDKEKVILPITIDSVAEMFRVWCPGIRGEETKEGAVGWIPKPAAKRRFIILTALPF